MSGTPSPEHRPPVAVAMGFASRVTTAALMMALPALGGYWLDTRWGTSPWLLVVGAVLGLLVGFNELLRLANRSARRGRSSRKPPASS